MRTIMIKDPVLFNKVLQATERNNGIHRKHDGSGVLEVINFGKYGYMKRIFTTERTYEEARR